MHAFRGEGVQEREAENRRGRFPVRKTGAVCLVIGVSKGGIGRPATRAKESA